MPVYTASWNNVMYSVYFEILLVFVGVFGECLISHFQIVYIQFHDHVFTIFK